MNYLRRYRGVDMNKMKETLSLDSKRVVVNTLLDAGLAIEFNTAYMPIIYEAAAKAEGQEKRTLKRLMKLEKAEFEKIVHMTITK